MKFLDDKCKYTNCLDENFDRVKCMDEINSKTIMLNENHIYMDESYKIDEIF
jgi:hypothetical protein